MSEARTDTKDTPTEYTFEELLAVLGHVDDYRHDHVSVCWEIPGRHSFTSELGTVEDAPQLVERLMGQTSGLVNVWFGVNPVDSRVARGRGTAKDIPRLTSLWGDLDVKDGGCPDLDTAHDIITEVSALLGERPCANTYSGHGMQPFWKLDRESAEKLSNQEAQQLARGFGRLLDAVAAHHGCKVDNVADLPRVLRVPGTNNVKDPDKPIPVWCETDTGAALTVEQVRQALDEFGIGEEQPRGMTAKGPQRFSRRELINRVSKAPWGSRNRTLFGAAKDAARQGDLDEDLADKLTDAAEAAGLHSAEIQRALMSGRCAGEFEADSAELYAADTASPAACKHRPHLRDRLLSVTDLAHLPPVRPLVDGLLYRDTLAQLSGPPGSYKSFAAVGMACAVATGTPFAGFSVRQSGRVVYIAAEGANGLNARILAWCEVEKVDPAVLDGHLLIVPEPVQLGQQLDVSEIVDVVREFEADLVIIDTRARCTVGLEENSATEQGRAIDAAEKIRAAAGCTVMTVHHSGTATQRGRGSTAWDGAVWSDLRMSGEGLQATIECAKHKDVPAGCKHVIALMRHTVSQHLMPSTIEMQRQTLVVSRSGSGMETLRANSQRIVLEIVRNCAPPEGLTATQVIKLAAEGNVGKTSVYNALKALLDDGELVNLGTDNRTRYAPKCSQC
ncbi:AAA family ATPase [Mycolicibacterium sp. 018/SC-01/001]|uniref:AAA family ATPase n=1 Tax=Mycolicibacterium sp. 018/SC-01/001 TaxID=2592069 RepID=UPI00117EEFCC|nr:AAA family ATPase [Mycolicibacterium sp. 018/SC-01/001]TRW81245.1 AAA family ATPase [Mycolicibacterium sp. 018/SC-01/001]